MLMLLVVASGVMAEDSSEGVSTFQTVALQKGSLILKEYFDCCEVDSLDFQTACLTNIETGEKVYALRVETSYYNSKYDNGTAVGVMDSVEIDGAIATLEYIRAHKNEFKDYSEVVYKSSNGMEVGAYSTGNGSGSVVIKVDSSATKYYEFTMIDQLIDALKKVQNSFGK